MDSNKEKSSILKSTREAKGLTIEIVHEATKIPMDALRAIEEGYSVRSLSPFYYRGFIKIYAEFLGLNVAEMYKHYGIDQPAVPKSSVTIVQKVSKKEPAAPNLFLEQLQEGVAFIFKPKTLKLILKAVGALVLLLLLFKMGGCIASHLHQKPAVVKKNAAMTWPQKRVEPPQQDEDWPAPAPAPVAVKHEAVQVQSVDDKVEVAVRANRNTWIQVKADGHVVFQMTLNKGSMESWTANDRIEMQGKNIEQLDMEVNGKHVGTLGGGERRIRKVLITKEGLTVKK